MKKTLALALALIMLVTCTCFASAEQVRVTTSFYPIHILAMNVFSGIDGIALECMTVPQTGCLHDYQLMVNDMMKLSDSNALIVCGAGMEYALVGLYHLCHGGRCPVGCPEWPPESLPQC